jgi:hypothetical protein
MPPKPGTKLKDAPDGDGPPETASGAGDLNELGKAKPQDILDLVRDSGRSLLSRARKLTSTMTEPRQVTYRQKLERSLKMREELTERNRVLREQLGQQKFEQREIFAYLNKELLQKSK